MEEVKNEEVSTPEVEKVEATESSEVIDREALERELREKIARELEADTDRRITEAIKKREKKLKEEQARKESLAKLSEEDRIKQIQMESEQKLREREREVIQKELKLTLVDVLNEEGLSLELRELIDVSKYVNIEPEDREEKLRGDIALIKKVFSNVLDNKVEAVKKEYLRGTTPKAVEGTTKPLSEYEKAKKSKDVRSMLKNKMNIT